MIDAFLEWNEKHRSSEATYEWYRYRLATVHCSDIPICASDELAALPCSAMGRLRMSSLRHRDGTISEAVKRCHRVGR